MAWRAMGRGERWSVGLDKRYDPNLIWTRIGLQMYVNPLDQDFVPIISMSIVLFRCVVYFRLDVLFS